MNKNYVDEFLNNEYSKQEVHLSSDIKGDILDKYEQKKRTGVGKRVLTFNICLVLAIVIMAPVTVYATVKATDSIRELIKGKVESAGLPKEELDDIVVQFNGQDNAEEYIMDVDELHVNSNNQTYGPDMWGGDLVAVISDEGEQGYVYRDELYADEVDTLEEAVNYTDEERVLNVYDSDGETIIGTFTIK